MEATLSRTCDTCRSPLDEEQRYCVRCGTRQRDTYDPAARYFSRSTQRRGRPATAAAEAPSREQDDQRAMRWAALFLALLPVAVALGVLVGKNKDDNAKLLDALKAQRGGAVAATAGPATQQASAQPVAATSRGGLTSDFPLDKGFAVKLSTLPLTATRADASKAEAAAKAKGAPSPGLINPRQFTTTPSSGRSYVLYAGASKNRAAAAKLLAKLKGKFAGAQVIAVQSTNAATAQSKVLAKTSLGTAHQVTGFKPTQARVKHDTQLVQQINRRTGQSYIQSQRGLPDQIVIGGTPGSAPAPPSTGPGQP